MDAADRASFGDEVRRLKDADIGLDPTTRALWATLRGADGAWQVTKIVGAVGLCGFAVTHLVDGRQIVALILFAIGTVTFIERCRRWLLTRAYRALARRLDLPLLGAVGGATSAALPSSFLAAKPSATPSTTAPAYPAIVRPQRDGDDDALDFDDND